MPYQRSNPQNIPLLKSPWEQDFAKLLQQGMQLRHEPERLMRQKEQEQFSNILRKEQGLQAQAETPFVGQRAQADINYKQAQAKAAEQQANLPFGGRLTGVANEALGLELLKQQYGPDSEVYKNAVKRYQSDLRSSDILNEYRQALSGTTEKRVATPFKKLEMEIEEINARKDLPDSEKERLTEMAKLAQIKGITLPEFQKRSAFASNIDKTLEKINPDNLVQYGGLAGEARKKGSKGLSALGVTLGNYKRYQDALTSSKLLAKQVRQFYGDSITPQVQEALQELVNPANWATNPEIAKSKFLTFKDLLLKETATYKNLLTNTKEYRNPESNKRTLEAQRDAAKAANIKSNAQPKQPASKRFKYVNGAWVSA